MDEKVFNNLSEEELLKGCNYCVMNAKAHFDSALKIAEVENYGIASSLLVLSVEESVKGLIFMVKLMGMDTPPNVERFFSSHESRHHTARDLYQFIKQTLNSVDEIREFIRENGRLLMIEYAKKGIPDDVESWKIEYMNSLTKMTADGINKIILAKLDDVDEEQERTDRKWWNKANQLKNNGFYVDYRNKWVLPQDITKNDFLENKDRVQKVIEVLQRIRNIDASSFDLLQQVIKNTNLRANEIN